MSTIGQCIRPAVSRRNGRNEQENYRVEYWNSKKSAEIKIATNTRMSSVGSTDLNSIWPVLDLRLVPLWRAGIEWRGAQVPLWALQAHARPHIVICTCTCTRTVLFCALNSTKMTNRTHERRILLAR